MIHVTAIIDPRAEVHADSVSIGRLSQVWQFASVIRRAELGELCRVASCAIVDGARLGNRCVVSHGAFIGPGVVIEDDVFIGPNVSMCNDTWPRVDRTGFDIGPLIDGSFVTARILAGASIGAAAAILPGVVIGRGAMIAAGAVVTAYVPDGQLWKRDGSLVVIDPDRARRRMRRVA